MLKRLAAYITCVSMVLGLSCQSMAANKQTMMITLPSGISDAANAAKDKAGKLKDTVSNTAGELSDKASSTAQSVTNKIDDATKRKVPSLIPQPGIPQDATIIDGTVYTFDQKNKYVFTEAENSQLVSESDLVAGTFCLTGSITYDADIDGMPVYFVDKGNVDLIYAYGNTLMAAPDEKWHLTDDGGKNIDTAKLEKKIGNGVLLLQTSVDGESWVTDKELSNAFEVAPSSNDVFYTTKPLQLMNGCYYRFIVAYELEKKVNTKKVGLVNVDENEYKKQCEVYKFYLTNKDTDVKDKASSQNKQALGTKIRTENNSGYSKVKEINNKDPHFGWDLGSFFVTGFTSSVGDKKDNPVFLKNVGDKITLWFNLEQKINELNGDPTLSISEDKDGWDKTFEIPKTNFKHGMLIIKKTDHQGVAQEPVKYVDFLAANAKTGADTKIVLFEEGDYEVSLDYQIKKSPRQVAGADIIPQYYDYKIAFKYSIRNGNCMVYPFDIVTGSELADKASTKNGFKLDMAKSRYLKINVKKEVLNESTKTLDTRFNRPATDGEEYTDAGIYTFTVSNEYTGESTTKVIYVGDDETVALLKRQ